MSSANLSVEALSAKSLDELERIFSVTRVSITEAEKPQAIDAIKVFFTAFKTVGMADPHLDTDEKKRAKFALIARSFSKKFAGLENLLSPGEFRKLQIFFHPDRHIGVIENFPRAIFQLMVKSSESAELPEPSVATEEKEEDSTVDETGATKFCSTLIQKIEKARTVYDKLQYLISEKSDKSERDAQLFDPIKSVTDFMKVWEIFEGLCASVSDRERQNIRLRMRSFLNQFLLMNYKMWAWNAARTINYKIKNLGELNRLLRLSQAEDLLDNLWAQPGLMDTLISSIKKPADFQILLAFVQDKLLPQGTSAWLLENLRSLVRKMSCAADLNVLVVLCREHGLLSSLFNVPRVLVYLERSFPMEEADRIELRTFFVELLSNSSFIPNDEFWGNLIQSKAELLGVLASLGQTETCTFDLERLLEAFLTKEGWRHETFASLVKGMTQAFSGEGLEKDYKPTLIELFSKKITDCRSLFRTFKALATQSCFDDVDVLLSQERVIQLIHREVMTGRIQDLNEFVRELQKTGMRMAIIGSCLMTIPGFLETLNSQRTSLADIQSFIDLFDKGSFGFRFFELIADKIKITLYALVNRDQIQNFMKYLKLRVAEEDFFKIALRLTEWNLNLERASDFDYLKRVVMSFKANEVPFLRLCQEVLRRCKDRVRLIQTYQKLKSLFTEIFSDLPEAERRVFIESFDDFLKSIALTFQINTLSEVREIIQALVTAKLTRSLHEFVKKPEVLEKISSAEGGFSVLHYLTDKQDREIIFNRVIPLLRDSESLCHLLAEMGFEEDMRSKREEALNAYLKQILNLEDLMFFISVISHRDQRVFSNFISLLEKARSDPQHLTPAIRAEYVLITLITFFKTQEELASQEQKVMTLSIGLISAEFYSCLGRQIQGLIENFLRVHSKTKSTKNILKLLKNFEQSPFEEKVRMMQTILTILDDSNYRTGQYDDQRNWMFRLFHGRRSPEAEGLYEEIRQKVIFMGQNLPGSSHPGATIEIQPRSSALVFSPRTSPQTVETGVFEYK